MPSDGAHQTPRLLTSTAEVSPADRPRPNYLGVRVAELPADSNSLRVLREVYKAAPHPASDNRLRPVRVFNLQRQRFDEFEVRIPELGWIISRCRRSPMVMNWLYIEGTVCMADELSDDTLPVFVYATIRLISREVFQHDAPMQS